jgi:hypothetical protein
MRRRLAAEALAPLLCAFVVMMLSGALAAAIGPALTPIN